MTRFNPKNDRTPEEWSILALKQTSENNIQWNVIGGLMIAAIATSATTPITGLLVAAYFLYDSYKKARGVQRNQAAVREYGCISQVLNGDDFNDYLEQIGKDKVLAELKFAAERDYSFSETANDFYQDETQVKLPSTFLVERDDSAKENIVVDNNITMNSLIIKGNKFIEALVDTTLSCIFLGIPGTGKSTILGIITGRMQRKYGGKFTIKMIAMKGDALLNVDPIIFYKEPEIAFEVIYGDLEEHRRRASMPKKERLIYAAENPYRVIIDDYTSQQQKLNGIFKDLVVEYGIDKQGEPKQIKLPTAYEDALNELWFNGRETNVGIWLGTHSETIDDLRFVSSKSGRSSGLLCFLGRRDKVSHQGHYDIISGNLKHFIVSDKQHLTILKNQFPQAMQLAYDNDKPLALVSGIDGGSFGFAIVPDLTKEYQSYLLGELFVVEEAEQSQKTSEKLTPQPSTSNVVNLPERILYKVEERFEDVEEKKYTPNKLTVPQLRSLIHGLKSADVAQTKIIETLWLVKPGGGKNDRWYQAREEYRLIARE